MISRNRYCLVLANIHLKFMIFLSSRNKILMLYYLNVFAIITKFRIFFFNFGVQSWFLSTFLVPKHNFSLVSQWNNCLQSVTYREQACNKLFHRFINCDVQCCNAQIHNRNERTECAWLAISGTGQWFVILLNCVVCGDKFCFMSTIVLLIFIFYFTLAFCS